MHAALAERDRLIPGLRILFEPPRLIQAIESASAARLTDLTPVYVRYKSGTSCLVAYRAHGPMGSAVLYAKAFRRSTTEKLQKAAAIGTAASWLGYGPLVLPGEAVIVRAFPDDARLRLLCRVSDAAGRALLLRRAPESLRDPTAEFQTLAYRPERRFVAELHPAATEAAAAVIKMYTPAGYERAVARTRIAVSQGVLRVPRRLARDSRRHLLCLEWLPGRLARHLARSHEPLRGQTSLVGEALAELHAQPVSTATPRSSAYDRADVARVLDDVALVLPRFSEPLVRLRARIDGALAERHVPAIVHGDLHFSQILVSAEGVGFVDFDRAGAGPAAGDIASCLAHLERDVLTGDLDAARAGEIADDLLSGYGRLRTPPASRVLRVFTAAALARLLPEPFRHCRADALDLTAGMLDRALAIATSAESTAVAL